MNTKILGFALMLVLLINPAFAQDELLIEEESSAPAEDDLFGGDFFSDLDSFLAEEEGEVMNPDPDPALEDMMVEPISNDFEEPTTDESFQSSPSTTSSGVLPTSAQVTMTVVNTSQDNADATQSGARPGDVLRYEIMLNSQTEDVVNYVPTINVSGIESVVEFTNTGFGVREDGQIIYPSYSHQAPCTQAFTFFVRVNSDCGEMTSMAVSSTEAGSVSVPLNCGLAQTGPSQAFYLLAGFMMVALAVVFSVFGRRRTS